jgi:hypothetical protein
VIICRAIQDQSLYLTSCGTIIPCCYIETNGPFSISKELKEFAKEENFESLVATWNTDKPYPRCYHVCNDTNSDSPAHMVHFNKQYFKEENK